MNCPGTCVKEHCPFWSAAKKECLEGTGLSPETYQRAWQLLRNTYLKNWNEDHLELMAMVFRTAALQSGPEEKRSVMGGPAHR